MKRTDKELDTLIRSSVQKVDLRPPTPSYLQIRVMRRSRKAFNVGLITLAAAASIFISLLHIPKPGKAPEKISEIKTELTLQNKNIKILWIQKPDFELPESMRGGKES